MSQSLQLIYQRLVDNVSLAHHRFLYHQINLQDRLIGLVGPRGVGKTTLLLQLIKTQWADSKQTFYVSADHIYFADNTLYAFIEDMYLLEGIKTFFIDEIHKYKNWSQELKNIYDGFPDMRLVFSGSSSLDLIKGSYDLSRRAKIYYLPGMSFREYLNMYTNSQFAPISFTELMANHQAYDEMLTTIPKIKGHFRDYLQRGFYPFYQESPLSYYERLLQVIDKTISEDIANCYNFKTANLRYFKKLLAFLASITPGTMNVHNLSQHLSIDGKTVMHYLQSLQETGLITLIYPAEGGNQGLRRPEKMFLNNTNLHYAINGEINTAIDIGSVRELFFIQAVSNAGENVFYSKQGDYEVANYVFEIGGRNKTRRQIKGLDNSFVVKDDSLVSCQREIPLVLFGFLY